MKHILFLRILTPIVATAVLMAPGFLSAQARGAYDGFEPAPLTARVLWDGNVITGVSFLGGLSRRTDVLAERERAGGRQRLSPGLTHATPLVIERPMGPFNEFETWAELVFSLQGPPAAEFRKDIVIQWLDRSGRVVRAYIVRRCWPSEYSAFGETGTDGRTIQMERIVLVNEGWERDRDVPWPPTGR